jgi:hypothetical protein
MSIEVTNGASRTRRGDKTATSGAATTGAGCFCGLTGEQQDRQLSWDAAAKASREGGGQHCSVAVEVARVHSMQSEPSACTQACAGPISDEHSQTAAHRGASFDQSANQFARIKPGFPSSLYLHLATRHNGKRDSSLRDAFNYGPLLLAPPWSRFGMMPHFNCHHEAEYDESREGRPVARKWRGQVQLDRQQQLGPH